MSKWFTRSKPRAEKDEEPKDALSSTAIVRALPDKPMPNNSPDSAPGRAQDGHPRPARRSSDRTGLALRDAAIIRPTPPDRLFSRDTLERAWLAIKRAGGGAGVDGMTLSAFEREKETTMAALQAALVGGTYKPQPMRHVLIPKPNGGLRALAIWALRDRIAQRAVYDIIAPAFEPLFLPCSFGFRPGRGVQDAVEALVNQRDRDLRWVADGDIKECFDGIESRRLMGLVQQRVRDPLLNKYIAGWLFAHVLNSADGVPKEAGASQGSALSPLLANIYLHEVDRQVTARGLAYLRYADNFVICCRRKNEAEEALALCGKVLAQWGLALNPHKSRVVHFDQGFPWLGYFFIRREVHSLGSQGAVQSVVRPAARDAKGNHS